MSDLTTFRDHCRAMSDAKHRPECFTLAPQGNQWWFGKRIPIAYCCEGCVTDADRALFARLADEVDGYLDPHPQIWEDA